MANEIQFPYLSAGLLTLTANLYKSGAAGGQNLLGATYSSTLGLYVVVGAGDYYHQSRCNNVDGTHIWGYSGIT